MPHLLRLSIILLAGWSATARAELRLLASATSDSYQSLTFGLSGFCQAAGFPFALTEINAEASELLMIPNLAGLDVRQRFWLFWLTDEQQQQQKGTVVAVAILPTADNARATMQALTNAYPVVRMEKALWQLAQRTNALNTASTPELYVAVRRGTVLVSASREAVLWASSRPLPDLPSGAAAVAGQVRFEIQPALIATLLADAFDQMESNTRLSELSTRVLADIRTILLVLETTTGGLTARLTIEPVPDSRLTALFRRMRPPAESFWQICPDQATLAMAGGGADIWHILATYETNRTDRARNAKTLLGDCLTGDGAVFIERTSDTGTLYYAQTWGITNREAAWNRALSDPLALLPFEPSFRFATNRMRTVRQTPVLDLVRSGVTAPANRMQTAANMAAFLIRDGGLSLAATSNCLVMTFGPSNAIEQVLYQMANPRPPTSLPLRCRKLLPDLPDTPCAAGLLQPAGLIRKIALSLPGLKTEQLATFPLPGNGIAMAATRAATNDIIHLTLCVSADEVSRLPETMRKGQTALRELFMLMALQQMLRSDPSQNLPDPRDPKGQPQR